MPTQQNIDRVRDIKDRLERSSIAMTTSYSGISVNQMTELRRAMRGGGVDFIIVKNTLLALAADEAQKPQLKEIIQGPTAIAFGYDDPVDAAKVVADYIQTGRSALAIMGAIMGDGAPMSVAEVTQLASLPPRAQLLAMLLGQMQAPIAQLLTILNGPLQSLENVLQARARQLEEEGPAPTVESEPAPEPETDAAAEPAAEADETPAAEAPTDEASGDDEPTAETAEEFEPEPAAEEASPDEPAGEDEPDGSAGPEPEAEADEEAKPESRCRQMNGASNSQEPITET